MPDIQHKFSSAVADGGDATLVRPSNWNDDHVWPLAYDQAHLTLAAGQFTFQFGRLAVSSTNRVALQGDAVSTPAARMVVFGWFNMPAPAMYQIIGFPFRPTSSFRVRDGYAHKWMGRCIITQFVTGVVEGDGEMRLFDDPGGSRLTLTGRG